MTIEDVIIYCFKSGEAMRYTTLYHLLKGKKTSSILCFGKLYHLLDFFDLFPKLSQAEFNNIIIKFISEGYLVDLGENRVRLTRDGQLYLDESLFQDIAIQQMTYDKIDVLFFQRLVFVSQILSNKTHHLTHYDPIDNDAFHQMRVKIWLNYQGDKLTAEGFYDEWVQLFPFLNDNEQSLLVNQLSGAHEVGLTLSQISQLLDMTQINGYLLFKTALHKFIATIETQPLDFPLFYSLFILVKDERQIGSIETTKELFSKGLSFDDISYRRQLKPSTISDHLIEMFITQPKKVLEDVLPKATLTQLIAYKKDQDDDYKNWRYSELINHIPDLSFYEFRWGQFYFVELDKEVVSD